MWKSSELTGGTADWGRRVSILALSALLALTVGCSVQGDSSSQNASAQSGSEPGQVPDTASPQLLGLRDLTVALNGNASYRENVSAVDDTDGVVPVVIDASAVDLTTPGEYPVIYSAEDSAGNRVEETITVTVVETLTTDQGADAPSEDKSPDDGNGGGHGGRLIPLSEVTQEDVSQLADQILAEITTSGMSQYEKAKAIFNYVNKHIKYVGSSDKSSWIVGAYVGFTRGRGDCYNYFACSKVLLDQAGIPNVDLQREGGKSRHYWQLVNTGDGWYHFDSCPHPTGYPMYSFMFTEAQARSYTKQVQEARQNYYVYDYDSCPVSVMGMPDGTSQNPGGSQPSAGDENPDGSQPTAGGENPDGSQPTAGGENPDGSQPTAGDENPDGSQPTAGGENPDGSQPPAGDENPDGSQPPAGDENPDGSQPPAGDTSSGSGSASSSAGGEGENQLAA